METNHRTNNALKQALQQRKQGELPSNFSFRMMDQLRREAVRQQKRRDRIMFYSIVVASVLFIAAAAYLLYTMDLGLLEWFPRFSWKSISTDVMLPFYVYIAVLVLALLGLDYWMRHKKSVS